MTTHPRSLAVLLAALCLTMPARGATAADDSPPAAAPAGRAAADNEPTYRLRYQFTPGETLRWDVTHRSNVRTTVTGTTQRAESISESVKVWEVEDVDEDGNARFVYSVEDVTMLQRLTGRDEVRYDSNKDDDPPPGFAQVAESVDRPLSVVTLSPRGEVIERERKHKASAVPDEQQQGDITIPLPEKAVPIGHTWSRPHTINVNLETGGVKEINTRQSFTLEDVKTGVATIRVRTTVLTPVTDPAIEAQLTQCAAEGRVRFDIDAGRVLSQRMDTDKHVVGFRGDASSLHYVTRFTERLVDQEPAARTAKR
jgi:hypothetical protein